MRTNTSPVTVVIVTAFAGARVPLSLSPTSFPAPLSSTPVAHPKHPVHGRENPPAVATGIVFHARESDGESKRWTERKWREEREREENGVEGDKGGCEEPWRGHGRQGNRATKQAYALFQLFGCVWRRNCREHMLERRDEVVIIADCLWWKDVKDVFFSF